MRIHLLTATVLALLCFASLGADAPAKGRPLETGIIDYDPFFSSENDLAFKRIRRAGAHVVRIYVAWWAVAPDADSEQKPAGFDAGDPADPGYDWSGIDYAVR